MVRPGAIAPRAGDESGRHLPGRCSRHRMLRVRPRLGAPCGSQKREHHPDVQRHHKHDHGHRRDRRGQTRPQRAHLVPPVQHHSQAHHPPDPHDVLHARNDRQHVGPRRVQHRLQRAPEALRASAGHQQRDVRQRCPDHRDHDEPEDRKHHGHRDPHQHRSAHRRRAPARPAPRPARRHRHHQAHESPSK
jgi:hypothetical protein